MLPLLSSSFGSAAEYSPLPYRNIEHQTQFDQCQSLKNELISHVLSISDAELKDFLDCRQGNYICESLKTRFAKKKIFSLRFD